MKKGDGAFIMISPERCLGCHTCELACAVAHTRSGTLFGSVLAGDPLAPRNRVVKVAEVSFPAQCRQCEDAPCVKVCPTGATFRTETYTAVNTNHCIACGLCTMVCPFGAIHVSTVPVNGKTKRAAIKCDLCVDTASHPVGDQAEGPACVQACPTQALRLAVPREVIETAQQASAERFLEALKIQKQSQ